MVWVFRALFCLALGVVAQYSLMPNPSDITEAPAIYLCDVLSGHVFADAIKPDKITHFLAYGGLGFLLVAARMGAVSRLFIAWLLVVAVGGALEIGQMSVPNRYAELSDLIADGLGAALGVMAGATANALLDTLFSRRDRIAA